MSWTELVLLGLKTVAKKAVTWITAGVAGYEIGKSLDEDEQKTIVNTTIVRQIDSEDHFSELKFLMIIIIVLALLSTLAGGIKLYFNSLKRKNASIPIVLANQNTSTTSV